MSGCYRCGLADGSAYKLCETCLSHRYYNGEPVTLAVVDNNHEDNTEIDAPELSRGMKRWLLSGGAVLYLAVVGLGVLVQGERIEARRIERNSASYHDLIYLGGNQFPVRYDTEVSFAALEEGR
jgi:hypothetical protein